MVRMVGGGQAGRPGKTEERGMAAYMGVAPAPQFRPLVSEEQRSVPISGFFSVFGILHLPVVADRFGNWLRHARITAVVQ